MANYLVNLEMQNVHGFLNYNLNFNRDINILLGNNGCGKTTLLHILANVLSGDFERFAFLDFSAIILEFSEFVIELHRYMDEFGNLQIVVEFSQQEETFKQILSIEEILGKQAPARKNHNVTEGEEIGNGNTLKFIETPYVYLPAFRNVVEAYKYANNINNSNNTTEINELISEGLRRWLLPFVPCLKFPSLFDISDNLIRNMHNFELIDGYLEVINFFFEDKRVIVNQGYKENGMPPIEIIFKDGSRAKSLLVLSSGERQIVTIMYAIKNRKDMDILLIDEPEISLHLDWQRILLRKIIEQSMDEQIIVCTHSPAIISDYHDKRLKLSSNVFHE